MKKTSLKELEIREVFENCVDETSDGLIARSPIVKQPHTRAYSVVICRVLPDTLVVWNRYYPDFPDTEAFEHERGDYFEGLKKLPEAMVRFSERVAMQAEFVKSTFRHV